MKNKVGILKIATIVFVVAAIFVLFYVFYIPSGNIGEPNIMVRSLDIMCSDVSQVLNDDKNIYASFDDGGVIQVYDLNGDYKYTISMFSHPNGGFEMALDDGTLYVHDKQNNLYEFSERELVRFLYSSEESNRYVDGLNFKENSDNYEVRSGSVWDITSENEKCIIRKTNIITIIFSLFLILFVGIILSEIYKKNAILKERNMK